MFEDGGRKSEKEKKRESLEQSKYFKKENALSPKYQRTNSYLFIYALWLEYIRTIETDCALSFILSLINPSLPKANLTKPRKPLNLELYEY